MANERTRTALGIQLAQILGACARLALPGWLPGAADPDTSDSLREPTRLARAQVLLRKRHRSRCPTRFAPKLMCAGVASVVASSDILSITPGTAV